MTEKKPIGDGEANRREHQKPSRERLFAALDWVLSQPLPPSQPPTDPPAPEQPATDKAERRPRKPKGT